MSSRGGVTVIPFYSPSRYDVLFLQSASTTHGNSTNEADLVGAGAGSSTIVANYLRAGRAIRVTARGFFSTKSANPGNMTFRVRIGGITGVVVLASESLSPPSGASNKGVTIEADITCRIAGTVGTVFSQGHLILADDVRSMVSAALATIDTTVDQAIAVTLDWTLADPANTFTITNLIIEAIN